MKNAIRIGILAFSVLSCTSLFAEEGSTTSTTVTQTNAAGTTNKSVTTSTTTTTVHDKDADIVSAIYAKYAKEAALIGTNITATSQNGIVTLDGDVTMQSQADDAIQVAKSIPGVKDVRSTITIKTNPKEPPKSNPSNY